MIMCLTYHCSSLCFIPTYLSNIRPW